MSIRKGRKIVSSFWFSRAADDFHTPATESDIKEKKNALGLFPECVFTGCTCDGHLFLFFLSSSSEIPARDSTSLSRQTKKHWLKIRNAECFPAFVWLCSPCTIQKNSSTESCRSNHTFERWTRAKTFLFDCVAVACSSGVFGRFFLLFPRCCCCVLTQTQLQDVIAFTITSQCDFKDFFPFFFASALSKASRKVILMKHAASQNNGRKWENWKVFFFLCLSLLI